jgi:serine protease AprX
MVQQIVSKSDLVYFEAVIPSESGQSIFAQDAHLDKDNIQQFTPPNGRGVETAKALQALGFTIRNIGTFSVSAEGNPDLWQRVFNRPVEQQQQPVSEAHPELGYINFYADPNEESPFDITSELTGLVERAYPQRLPIIFESPIPPKVTYHHLQVPSDVALICRSMPVHKLGVTGQGVLVAMVDTGFYKHPFYAWHGYNYNATLAPDAKFIDKDEVGHGTAEAANIFSNAPDIDFVGIKWGFNPTLAFKIASDLHPAIISNSWGYSLCGNNTLPPFLKPLEAAIIEAVKVRGITVCFSAGNGHYGFPGMMPEVISVGGVYAGPNLTPQGNDFELEASDYASSFDSEIYAGRHVPDLCGLVGKKPRAIYIMLPVEPGDSIDTQLGGAGYPNKDETDPKDGWAVISGTSAACPQIAGVCALLKQVQPGLSPELIKSILRASARDVSKGRSNNVCGKPELEAGHGHDGATGAGLVDAFAAYKLARSVKIRNIFNLPSPR